MNESQKAPKPVQPGELMFSIWAIQKQTTSEGTHMLVQAAMHLHVSDVLDRLVQPIRAARIHRMYEQQYMLRLLTVWKDRVQATQTSVA